MDWVIDNLMPGRYIRNMGGFEDHMRELAPGVWMGEVYARPFMLSWDLAFGNLSVSTLSNQNRKYRFLITDVCPFVSYLLHCFSTRVAIHRQRRCSFHHVPKLW